MARPLITPKSPRRRLFDDEIMAQIGLRSGEVSIRPKRRRYSFCARIALLLFGVALIAHSSTYYILMNRDTPSTKVEEHNTESRQSARRDAGTTISESYCIPESNVVANPMFVDFEHWDMSPSSEKYNSTYWLPDGSPAGAYMHSIPEAKYEDGDYPSLVQKITLVPGRQYNISLSTQFKPIKFDNKVCLIHDVRFFPRRNILRRFIRVGHHAIYERHILWNVCSHGQHSLPQDDVCLARL
ncbi:hypothetical protein V1517DRAFT_157329 [Lipomyces orientalis]|uniref:Uncharacterized protein n=1 Tax=Lipomyces orientalis TaxID=1233043 RepID=A0ACC3TM15_9ASCO